MQSSETVTGSRSRRLIQAPSLYTVAAIAVLGALFLVALAPRFDPDFWWHLKVGQYIAQHHSVPSRDYLTYWYTGHAWIDHEWLPELAMYGLYRAFGLEGPVFAFALIITAAYALVYGMMVRQETPRLLALLLVILAAVASTGSWGPRVQMLSLLFVALYAFALQGFIRSRDRRVLWLFPLVMVLWTNCHGGFVLGLVIMAVTLLGEALNRRGSHPEALDRSDLKALAVSFVFTCLATLLNANGLRQLAYPLTFLRPNPFTNVIAESASPNFHLVIMGIFEALLLLGVLTLYRGERRISWTPILLTLVFTYLALDQSRNVPLWCVVVTPFVALWTQETLRWRHHGRRLAGGIKSVINLIFLALLVVIGIRGAGYITAPSTIHDFETRSFPVAAVRSMTHHRLPSHVFAAYTWAGYLLWSDFPRYRDFMDSRADTVFTASVLSAYQTMYNGNVGWSADLHRYGVQTVLVPPSAPLAQLLALDSGWQRRYRDGAAVIYTRH
jgi:hypothetical protein